MDRIRFEIIDGIAILSMSNGKNPQGSGFVEEMNITLDMITKDREIKGLVLSSDHERFFSIGLDLPDLIDLSKDEFASFLDSYNRMCLNLYTMSIPTVAAINGHATAGGCIIAMMCDHRFMAEGRSIMGLNEVKLGVPVPYHADRILHDMIGSRNAMEMMASGDFYSTDRLLELGVIDRVVPPEELVDQATEHVRSIGGSPLEAFSAIKANRTDAVTAWIEESRSKKDAEFVEMWYSEKARAGLRAAMEKF